MERYDSDPAPSTSQGQDAVYKKVMDKYQRAKSRWNTWTDVWEEIYDYVFPDRESFYGEMYLWTPLGRAF